MDSELGSMTAMVCSETVTAFQFAVNLLTFSVIATMGSWKLAEPALTPGTSLHSFPVDHSAEVSPILCVLSQFEVVNKEDTAQSRPGIPLPALSSATRSFLRPPRPSVRLSTHPYQTSRQARKPPQHGAYHEPAPSAYPGSSQGYQQLALLPIPEPDHAAAGVDKLVMSPNPDASAAKSQGPLSEAAGVRQLPRQGRHGAAPAQQPRQAALSPSRAPLEEFTEQLQADLGGSLRPPPSPFSPQRSAPLPAPQQHAPAPLPAAVSLQQPPATHTVDPAATRAAAPMSAAPRPQEPLVQYPVITAPAPTQVQTRPDGGLSQTRQMPLQQQQVPPGPPPLRPPPPTEPSLRGPSPINRNLMQSPPSMT